MDESPENEKQKSCADEESLLESGPTFSPKVSQQRYTFIRECIKSYKSRKVIDMGCGECQLIIRLKREMGIEQLAGIDINRNFLDASKHMIQPLLYEYIHGREAPLEATLYQGSIAECDSRLVDWDFMACVEVIEHLEADILKEVPYVIFGYLKPAVVVITTPNKDFNVLFPGMENKFRHWDHKFEWTRQEFQQWGDQICNTYGYKVKYTGVGAGPDGTEHLGTCTQIAVFDRLEEQQNEALTDTRQKDLLPYSVVQHSVFPYKPDTKTLQDKILLEAEYLTNKLSIDETRQHRKEEEEKDDGEEEDAMNQVVEGQFDDAEEDDNEHCDFANSNSSNYCSRTSGINDTNTRHFENEDGSEVFEVPLARLMEFDGLQKMCSSIDLLRSVLKSSKMLTLSSDELSVLYVLPDDDKYPLLVDETDLQDEDVCLQRPDADCVAEESWD